MLCDKVIRELAVPTDDRDATALAEHLAACPTCSDWAARIARIDRLWKATRPAEPSPETWDAVWNRITRTLDCPETIGAETIATPLPSTNGSHPLVVARPSPSARSVPRSGPHRFAMIALIGLAQAAAVLLAVGLAWQPPGPNRPRVQTPPIAQIGDPKHSDSIPMTLGSLEIEEGQFVVIRLDGPAPEMVNLTPERRPFGADPWLEMHNVMESGLDPKVAMKE